MDSTSNSTTFTPVQEHRYADLFNDHLKLPLENESDFQIARVALESLSQNFSTEINIPERPALTDKIHSLQELHSEPECYVEEQHIESFKSLLLQKVQEKIEELRNLTPAQKAEHIENQRNIQRLKEERQAVMQAKKRPEPGSAGHVIDESEYTLEQERRSRATVLILSLSNLLTNDLEDTEKIQKHLRSCCQHLNFYRLDELDFLLSTALRYNNVAFAKQILLARLSVESPKEKVRSFASILLNFDYIIFSDDTLLKAWESKEDSITQLLILMEHLKVQPERSSSIIHSYLDANPSQESLLLIKEYYLLSGFEIDVDLLGRIEHLQR